MTNSPLPYTLATPNTKPPITWGYWVVEDLFLAGTYPGSQEPHDHRLKVQTLLDAGIRTFINLTEPTEEGHDGRPFVAYEPEVWELSDGWPDEPQCLRFAVRDLGVPTSELMTAILDAIDDSLAAGRPVYVHCWGGVGRTSTVVGCWLLRHGLAANDTVMDILQKLREQDRERGHRPAPENRKQWQFVCDWPVGM